MDVHALCGGRKLVRQPSLDYLLKNFDCSGIAVCDLAMSGWMAGGVVARTVARALSVQGSGVRFVCSRHAQLPDGVLPLEIPECRPLPGENTLRSLLRLNPRNLLGPSLRTAGVSVVIPLVKPPDFQNPSAVGWIPDFQHRHLPHLFSPAQIRELDRRFFLLAARCKKIWLSSESAASDFRDALPKYADKVRVASFPSTFAFESPVSDPDEVLRRYRIPQKFLLVVNQFWRHKNHVLVAKAIAKLHENGISVPLVIAGMPVDYRDKENSALSETLQILAQSSAWAHCRVLGKLQSSEIEGLLRAATALIQPSRFEGWNTSVEDAKALGCPVFLSDIPVHREQCPDALGFFGCDDPDMLADLIARKWEDLPVRPDPVKEHAALESARENAHLFGKKLFAICEEAAR